jgi:small subunit ribosomal protein S16
LAVKIRLKRVGTKKKPYYRVVAVDSRKKRDGEVLDWLGQYQPIVKTDQFVVDETRTLKWLNQGAQPTETIQRLLKKTGIWQKFKSGNA